jgi:quercetin dioxygenase-like cupin family protein
LLFFDVEVDVLNKTWFLLYTCRMNQLKKDLLKTSTQINSVPSGAGFLLSPSYGEKIWIVGDTLWFKATAAETDGAFTVFENISLPGNGPPPHLHENEDESIYVIDGEFEILLGVKTMRAEPGAFVFVPKGTVHGFRCIGDGPGKVLVHYTPGGIEGFFREAGVPATNDGPAPSVDITEITRTEVVGKRYGLRVIDWGDSGGRVNQS